MRCRLLSTLVLLVACTSGLPRADDVESLAHVELLDTPSWTNDPSPVRIYHTADIDPSVARDLLPQVAAVCSLVSAQLGFAPPRTELVLFELPGPAGGGGHVRETRGDLVQVDTSWRIRFMYPWRESPQAVGQLLGTTAHEVAEATVLLQVTVIDPYLRWLHDGIAELVEHEVLLSVHPDVAAANLRRMVQFVRESREDGVRYLDLTRWRQLASYLVRSHRFLGPRESNLDLNDLVASRRRVKNAMTHAVDPLFQRGLRELDEVLQEAQHVAKAPFRRGEARPDDPVTQDFLFYNAAFALWLALERERPGVARRTLAAMAKLREADDHVLTAGEARDLVREAASVVEFPVLEHFSLERGEEILVEEDRRLSER